MKKINDIIPSKDVLDEKYTILHQMFDWQKRFGDFCFIKNNIKDNDGNILSFDKIFQEYQEGKFGPNDLPNEWIIKFHECMAKELDELKDLTVWKHWSSATIGEHAHPNLSKEERINMLKIELVDIWHFLMSAMMCFGIGPDELHKIYISKNKVNFDRQNNGYNTANKTEADNIEIAKNIV